MTGSAGHSGGVVIEGMPRQGKACGAVIKGLVIELRRPPAEGRMAGSAVGVEKPGMSGWFFVTEGTLGGFNRKSLIGVAFLAGQGAVFAGQWKTGVGMVEGRQGILRRVKVAAAVILMTGCAGARLRQLTVQTIRLV